MKTIEREAWDLANEMITTYNRELNYTNDEKRAEQVALEIYQSHFKGRDVSPSIREEIRVLVMRGILSIPKSSTLTKKISEGTNVNTPRPLMEHLKE